MCQNCVQNNVPEINRNEYKLFKLETEMKTEIKTRSNTNFSVILERHHSSRRQKGDIKQAAY